MQFFLHRLFVIAIHSFVMDGEKATGMAGDYDLIFVIFDCAQMRQPLSVKGIGGYIERS